MHAPRCVLYVCVRPWFPQQTQLSGPLDCAYVTAALFQDPVLSKRSDKEAQESSQSGGRGCRVKGAEGGYPQTNTHTSQTRASADREGDREAEQSSEKQRERH